MMSSERRMELEETGLVSTAVDVRFGDRSERFRTGDIRS